MDLQDEEKRKEIIREERNRYQREWRKKNKDKVRAANERYWLKKAIRRKKDEMKGDKEE